MTQPGRKPEQRRKRMYIGAASGAVTLGLALLLVILSQKPDPSRAEKPAQVYPAAEKTDPAPPRTERAVRLPPPPVRRAAAPKSVPVKSGRPALRPRMPAPRAEIAPVAPLRPRPSTAGPPRTEPPAQVAKRPPDARPADPPAQTPTEVIAESGESAIVSRETVTEGRALLKMLETGRGPVIEIAWPAAAGERTRLYTLLTACHGMRTALLTGPSAIFVAGGAPGEAQPVNRDAVSGFLRQPSGVLTDAEQSVIRRIRSHHGMHLGAPVRLFPRAVDAALLGGIGQIVGAGYLHHKTIRGRYRLTGDRIAVTDLRADGEDRPGGVILPRFRNCG